MTYGYCTVDDLVVGDISLHDDLAESAIKMATDEIDAALGHLYVTPISSTLRHEMLILKDICAKLASCLVVLSTTRDGSERYLFGQSLCKEGRGKLTELKELQTVLNGAVAIDAGAGPRNSGPVSVGMDAASGVDAFYAYVTTPGWPLAPWEPGSGGGFAS